MKVYQYIKKLKYYHLIFKVALLSFETCFSFITFFDSYSIVNNYEIKLDKLFNII